MLAAVLLLSLNLRQDIDLYGKTQAQVLKMGEAAWFKYYTARAGDSTASMSSAYGIYGDIASKRNDRLLADPHLHNGVKIRRLRKLLGSLGDNLLVIGPAITGGGTMWNTVTEQIYADREDTIYAIIYPHIQPAAKHLLSSAFLKAISKVPRQLQNAADEGVLPADRHKEALADLDETKSIYRQIVKVAAGFDRATSDRILGHCLDQANLLKDL